MNNIFRWLMNNPIMMLGAFLLCCFAVISYALSGESSTTKTADTTSTETVKTSEVDLSEAPAIEPSSLTTKLVDGAESKTEEVSSTETPEGEKVDSETANEDTKTAENETATETKTDTEEVKSDAAEVVKEAETTTTAEVSNATTETQQAVAAKASSASDYFKEHGVDPALNKPVEVTTTEETQETATETATTEANAEADQATESVAAEQVTAVTETQFSEMSADELLLMAREAYWNNGLEESAEIYQQLISKNPEAIDYKGELGNVFWRQGFPKKAAELYAEISMPMIEAGNASKVANMVGFIGLFFPEKATEIHNKLQATK